MGFVGDIFNLEIGLAVRNKLNVLMKFYNAVVKSDSLFNVERIDASYVKDAVPTMLKYLRDDGTWQTINTAQTLAQILANGNNVGVFNLTSIDGNSVLELSDGDIVALYNSFGGLNVYPLFNRLNHNVKNSFDAPNNNFPQETINKIARFDAFGNLKSSTIDISDIDLEFAEPIQEQIIESKTGGWSCKPNS